MGSPLEPIFFKFNFHQSSKIEKNVSPLMNIYQSIQIMVKQLTKDMDRGVSFIMKGDIRNMRTDRIKAKT